MTDTRRSARRSEFIRMWNGGTPVSNIADKFGLTYHSVISKAFYLKLPKRKRKISEISLLRDNEDLMEIANYAVENGFSLETVAKEYATTGSLLWHAIKN